MEKNKKNKEVTKKPVYSNPAKKPYGKIIIGALIISMFLGSLVLLIYMIIQGIWTV